MHFFSDVWLCFSELKLNQENKKHCKYLIQRIVCTVSCRIEKSRSQQGQWGNRSLSKSGSHYKYKVGGIEGGDVAAVQGSRSHEGPSAEPLKLANMHLRQKRRGRNILVYLYFHPPFSCQCLPLSKSIRKPADTGGWQMQPAEAIQNRTVEGKGRGLGEESQIAQCPTSHNSIHQCLERS